MKELENLVIELIEQQKELSASLSSVYADDFKAKVIEKLSDIVNAVSNNKDRETIRNIYKNAESNVGVGDDFHESKASQGLLTELAVLEEILYEIKSIRSNNRSLSSEFFGDIPKSTADKKVQPALVSERRIEEADVKGPTKPKEEEYKGGKVQEEPKETPLSYIEKISITSESIKTLLELLPSSISTTIKEMNSSSEIREYYNSNKDIFSKEQLNTINSIQKDIYTKELSDTNTIANNVSNISSNNTQNNSSTNSLHTNTTSINNEQNNASRYDDNINTNNMYHHNANNINDIYNSTNIIKTPGDNIYNNAENNKLDTTNVFSTDNNSSSVSRYYESNNASSSYVNSDSSNMNNVENNTTNNSNNQLAIASSNNTVRSDSPIPSDIKLTLKSEKAIEDLIGVLRGMPGMVAGAVSKSITESLQGNTGSASIDRSPMAGYQDLDMRFKT